LLTSSLLVAMTHDDSVLILFSGRMKSHSQNSMSMAMHERHKSCTTLVCLLQALEGCTTTVELRNEIVVQGTIQHVDHRMK